MLLIEFKGKISNENRKESDYWSGNEILKYDNLDKFNGWIQWDYLKMKLDSATIINSLLKFYPFKKKPAIFEEELMIPSKCKTWEIQKKKKICLTEFCR